MKRPAQPEEIAPAYVFFASDADITGEILTLLGGETTTGYETLHLFAGIARMAPIHTSPSSPFRTNTRRASCRRAQFALISRYRAALDREYPCRYHRTYVLLTEDRCVLSISRPAERLSTVEVLRRGSGAGGSNAFSLSPAGIAGNTGRSRE